jgi:hypothetical protein
MDTTDPEIPSYRQAGLRCPLCGREPTWYNDVPLRAFCWGGLDDQPEHREWSQIVPSPYNPYLPSEEEHLDE